jgi:hypothetical protein
MERSEIRVSFSACEKASDCAALHPGYVTHHRSFQPAKKRRQRDKLTKCFPAFIA